jgi:hypothetical protein
VPLDTRSKDADSSINVKAVKHKQYEYGSKDHRGDGAEPEVVLDLGGKVCGCDGGEMQGAVEKCDKSVTLRKVRMAPSRQRTAKASCFGREGASTVT